ncbi:MAG: glycosyltransferase family 2 protein [Bacteroidetes bacterium]|nr:glycosyltransferase family 2 protein [Bacteroidota bacterium]
MIISGSPVAVKKISPVRVRSKRPSAGPKVSAVIITYNEEQNIRRTLSQLYWCDEVVIVDSYSTDSTLAICQEFGCEIYSKKFEGYGEQKRFAVSKASNDWILCIDADEVLTDKLVAEIINELSSGTSYSGFAIPMNLVFLDKEFTFGKESGRHFLRLFNKLYGGFTEDKVHESIRVEGKIKKLSHTIRHYSHTNLHQCMDKFNRYSTYSAEMAFAKGKKKSAFAAVFGLPFNFFKYYFLERNFMNGLKGFYWSVFSTYYHFSKYIKLRELQRTVSPCTLQYSKEHPLMA